MHVIVPHLGFGPQTSALEADLADWPIPSLVALGAGWLGELDAAAHFANFGPLPDKPEPPPFWWGRPLGTLFDSYLYLGPRRSLTRSTANPALYRGDEPYLQALQRRERNSHGLFGVESLLTEGDPRYFPD